MEEMFLRLLPDAWHVYEKLLVVNPILVKACITAATRNQGQLNFTCTNSII